jgi:carbon monoxide dehydrogenase subunit G
VSRDTREKADVQLEHSFSVPVGIAQAWPILIDIERIGPCLPGAAIDSVDGDDFTGTVKVKLGPINLTYKGKASFVEKDEAARRAVIDARGRDARGNGTAAAKITATLHEDGDATKVLVLTDLDITGKPAQFGRGVMVDVGNKLLGQFADCLAATLEGGEAPAAAESVPAKAAAKQAAPETAAPETAAPETASAPAESTERVPSYSVPDGVPAADPAEIATANGSAPAPSESTEHPTGRGPRDVKPIDLLQSAGPAVAKRLAPLAVALLFVLIAVRRLRQRG